MFSFLNTHPFAVEAFFESSIVLTFAIPKQQIHDLVPPCLEPDTFAEEWAFIAVAMVQTKGLRPKGLPIIFGNDFFLIGYRVFVRYVTNAGKKLRGLYILRSETDKKKMEYFGNIFTQYKYSTTDIKQARANNNISVTSVNSDFRLVVEDSDVESVALPENSPFADWKEARRFAGPLPFTFTFNPATRSVLIIEGVRENWRPSPVKVLDYHFSYLNKMEFDDIRLANAFIIKNIPYYWKKGKIEKCIT